MDLVLHGIQPTAEERAAVDAVLGAPAAAWDGGERVAARDLRVAYGGQAARARRHELLPALRAVQARVGWISEGALEYVCARLDVPPAEAWGVATFYALLATAPRPRRVLHVCDDVACGCRGADEIVAALERAPPGDDVTWVRSPCLGRCDAAPAALWVEAGERPVERSVGGLTPAAARALLAGRGAAIGSGSGTVYRGPLLARVGVVDPTSLAAYRAAGGYDALRRALQLGPEGVISEVVASSLVGRGGAGFPVGRKWAAVARQPARPHHLVCNADESEPGTFKDRVLLEGDPFAIVEAMTIAALACGCTYGWLYVRGEYPLARERVTRAIAQARAAGLLGADVLGSGLAFDVEVRVGAGAYVCGEETALLESIEGFRGEPRSKPPFPVEAGLFGRPTVVNNVETLANVPRIVLHGGAAFARVGTPEATGTRLFCVSGCVRRPGVYEVPLGGTLRRLVELAGGVRPGRRLTAVLLGGAAGVFVRPDELELPLTHEGARAAGATLGSGAVVVFDDTVDLARMLLRIAAFFRDESCGRCVPCRVGTVRQEEALRRVCDGCARGGVATEVALLDELDAAMRDASLCGLGQSASSAVASAIHRLRILGGGA